MSIFTQDTPPSAVKMSASAAKRYVEQEFNRRVGEHVDQWNSIWKSQDFTPQEFFDELGTEAGKYIYFAGLNLKMIKDAATLLGLDPSDLISEEILSSGDRLTINNDQTVTVE